MINVGSLLSDRSFTCGGVHATCYMLHAAAAAYGGSVTPHVHADPEEAATSPELCWGAGWGPAGDSDSDIIV